MTDYELSNEDTKTIFVLVSSFLKTKPKCPLPKYD